MVRLTVNNKHRLELDHLGESSRLDALIDVMNPTQIL